MCAGALFGRCHLSRAGKKDEQQGTVMCRHAGEHFMTTAEVMPGLQAGSPPQEGPGRLCRDGMPPVESIGRRQDKQSVGPECKT